MRYVKHGTIVVPGDKIADDDEIIHGGVYRKEDGFYSNCLGLFEEKDKHPRVTPLVHVYIPKKDDIVIGKIVELKRGNAIVDLAAPYNGILRLKKEVFPIGTVIMARIESAHRKGDPLLTIDGPNLGPLRKGVIFHFPPSKIPRLIGRGGSMINMLKSMLGIPISIGKNGFVWFDPARPEHIKIMKMVLEKVDRESHVPGLTNRVKELLEREIEKLNDTKEVKGNGEA